MRVLHPSPNILGFYDGRIPGVRAHSPEPNWLDDGAYALGVCTYAIVSEGEALVYDTHISLAHARFIRETLASRGISRITVVLSHWHRDHVAGNEVFADCEIVAHALTGKMLADQRLAIETGSPPIRPLVMPTRLYESALQLKVGPISVELRHIDIHSLDGTVLVLPDSGILLAGDTIEEPITYVAEPDRLEIHLKGLREVATWPIRRILPNHGDPDIIATGGYDPRIVQATIRYIERLLLCRHDPELAAAPLQDWLEEDVAAGILSLFPPYDEVHRNNVAKVLASKPIASNPMPQ
jgi:glyoxylase-like metal-dependent hydrolase (beta-lactamase superfamily II)